MSNQPGGLPKSNLTQPKGTYCIAHPIPTFEPPTLTLEVLDESEGLLPGDGPVVRPVDEVGQHEHRDVRRHAAHLPRHVLEGPRLGHVEEEDDAVRPLVAVDNGFVCSRPLSQSESHRHQINSCRKRNISSDLSLSYDSFLNAIYSSLVHVQELCVEASVEPVGSGVAVVGLGELQPVQLDPLLSLVNHIPHVDLRFNARFTINSVD